MRTPERSSSSWTRATRSSESASRSSLKRVSSWIRDGSISSSSARWLRISSSTSFLVIRLSDASSGYGPQNARRLQTGGGLLDHLLVDRALRQPDRVGDSLGSGLAVCDHDGPPYAEEDRAAAGVRIDLLAQPGNAPPDQKPADRGDRVGLDRVANRAGHGRRGALHELERDVAGEAIGHDDVGDPLRHVAALDVADEVERAVRQPGMRGDHVFGALVGLLAVREQADAGAGDP